MSLVFPSSPEIGDAFQGWTWNGVKWVCVGGGGGGGGGAGVTVGDTPPENPSNGALWWDTSGDQLSIWTGDEWIQASGGGGGGGPPFMGVTDGSNAAPGEIGETLYVGANYVFSANIPTSISMATLPLPPGDWDVTGMLWFSTSANVPPIGGLIYAEIYPSGGVTMDFDIANGIGGVVQSSATSNLCTATCGPVRMSTSQANRQVSLAGMTQLTSLPGSNITMRCRIRARRMR